MCGISGYISFRDDLPLEDYYARHLLLRHRGRDDEGFFTLCERGAALHRGDDTIPELHDLSHIRDQPSARVVLGHRRLAILDLSAHGHQPMSRENGRYVMIYNGEIYNYVELRSELISLGHSFESTSDTEVLLAAYAQWGIDCFSRLNGMWAVAIYDGEEDTLVLSRDRFGIKPLYYATVDATLYFASEVKFLLPYLPAVRMNEHRVKEYLVECLVDHHEQTLFEGVHQVLPATWMRVRKGGIERYTYWRVPRDRRSITLAEAVSELGDLLTSAVNLRLRSDVPVGSLLSGGLDSTTIVCLVRKLLDNKQAANNFECFSAVFHEEEYSERRYIEETVRQVGMPIHWVYPDPGELEGSISELLYHQEMPIRSLAVFSQWALMRAVRTTDIRVLLNGQGSDELFGGYTQHLAADAAEHLKRFRIRNVVAGVQTMVRERGYSPVLAAAMLLYETIKGALPGGALPGRPVSYLRQWYRSEKSWQRFGNRLSDRLSHDLTCSALPEFLRYEDRNSMAFTLETRLPFLDYRLVEWAFRLEDALKISAPDSKVVLREMASGLIPETIARRKDKVGFISPQEKWQRGILSATMERTFADDLAGRFPFLGAGAAQRIFDGYRSGRHDNWQLIGRIAFLAWWHKRWFAQ